MQVSSISSIYFSMCVSAAMNEVVGHSAYVCANVYTCDPFTRGGAEGNFLLLVRSLWPPPECLVIVHPSHLWRVP